MIEGDLPRKALFLVQEWAGEHREALQKCGILRSLSSFPLSFK